MRIVLDLQGAQTLGSRNRGIGRYAMGLAGGMARAADPAIDLRITLNAAFPDAIEPIIEALSTDLPRKAFSIYTSPPGATWPPPEAGDPAQAAAAAAARLHMATLEPDAVLLSSIMEGFGQGDVAGFPLDMPGVLSAAVLYDLTPLHDPDQFLSWSVICSFYHRQVDLFRQSDLLLAISESTRQDGIERLDRGPDTVITIGTATDPIFRTASRSTRSLDLPKEPYLLLLGGADPNKNLVHAIDAATRLPDNLRRGRTVLHVGVLGEETQAILVDRMGGCMDLRFLGHVSDASLIAAIDHADLVLFPSRLEGFGLPALEAMIRGTPVLASNSTSLPEVVGENDLLSDPDDPEALARNIERLLRDPDLRAETGARLQARSEQFSWDEVGRTAVTAISNAVRSQNSSSSLRPPAVYGVDTALEACAEPVAAGAVTSSDAVDLLLLSGRVGAEVGPPRLLVDVTQTSRHDAGTGIQRVVHSIIEHLGPSLDAKGGGRSVQAVVLDAVGARTAPRFGAPTDVPILIRAGETLLMLDSSWAQYSEFGAVFENIRGHGGRVVTVIYDLVPLLHPDLVVSALSEGLFEIWLRRALIESDGLICISKAVADEVVTYVRDNDLPYRDGLRVGWWHLGSNLPVGSGPTDTSRPALARFLKGTAPVFLMVGTIEPRKRHATALEAMERLWEAGSDARLLIMGREGWNVKEFVAQLRGHREAGHRLLWVEGPTDAELGHGYDSATALLFPSIYEGYGLPVVEAARMGLGSICSDIPVLHEVGGEGAIYVPPDDAVAWAATIADVAAGRRIADPAHTSALSWDDSACQLLEVLYADRWHAVLRHDGSNFRSGNSRDVMLPTAEVPNALSQRALTSDHTSEDWELQFDGTTGSEKANRVPRAGRWHVLHHYTADFDPEELINRFGLKDQIPQNGVVTNFIGVRIPPIVMPSMLTAMAGTIEGPPDPGTWHADIAEWGAAFWAVAAAGDTFRMVELGCGWGCWMTNTGVLAKRLGKAVDLVGIEGNPDHLANAKTVLRMNNFSEHEFTLVNGVAAPRAGTALFPIPDAESEDWGGEAIFYPKEKQRRKLLNGGRYRELRCHTLMDLAGSAILDLLHIDIQGAEVDFIQANLVDMQSVVRRVLVGTHSRQIEGLLTERFLAAGWSLEIDRPAISGIVSGCPMVQIDGVQMWRNRALTEES